MMHQFKSSGLKLGIIAGGQLCKMLIQEASKWDIITYVLDPEDNCAAGNIASKCFKGHYQDFDAVYSFGKKVDLLTFELENINIDALKKLQSEGLKIIPDPLILELIQDKGLQKEFYVKHEIPTSPYVFYSNKDEILTAIIDKKLKFPFVQKLRKGGYDGRGVSLIKTEKDLDLLMEGETMVEDLVEIEKEIAVIVARNENGETRTYPPVEMVFDSKANLVDLLICPSAISEEQSKKALEYAIKLIAALDMKGILAVEFFINKKGEILVNESAPRTHNSGHHTIESVITSQFEQHIRAVLNLPLGSTQLKMPAVMINLLGEEGYFGPVYYEGIEECMAIEGVNIHLYGKKITRHFRKMGHVTVISDTLDEAIKKAAIVRKTLKVISWDKL